MNPKLTLGQRILADTDPVLKIVQIILFVLLVLVAFAVKFNIGSADLHTILGTVTVTGITVAQFSVKAVAAIQANGLNVATALSLLPDADAALSAVKDEIKSPAPIPDPGTAITNLQNAIASDAGAPPAVASIAPVATGLANVANAGTGIAAAIETAKANLTKV